MKIKALNKLFFQLRFTVVYSWIAIFALELSAQELKTLRIDPSSALSEGIKAAQYLEEVEYIPLETTQESTIGGIDKMEVTDRYIIITDYWIKKCVFIFLLDGSFVGKIKIEGSMRDPQVFWDDEQGALCLFKDGIRNYYTIEGKAISVIDSGNRNFNVYLGGNNYASVQYNVSHVAFPDTLNHEVKLFQGTHILKEYLPYNQKFSPIHAYDWISFKDSRKVFESGSKYVYRFVRPFDYGIYVLKDTIFYKEFEVILPFDRTFPESLLSDHSTYEVRNKRQYFLDYPAAVQQISSPFRLNNVLFFRLLSTGAQWLSADAFMYNLKTGTLIGFGSMMGDSLTYHLPLTDNGKESVLFLNRNFYTSDGHSVYTAIPAIYIINEMRDLKNKNISYPKSLLNLRDRNKRTDNHVIVRIKPKENF